MNVKANYWDKKARKYSQKPVPDEDIYKKKLKMTSELLNPTDKVLEIGCGSGTTALFHAGRVQSIKATDFSGEMIEIAKQKAKAQKVENVEFIQEDCETADLGVENYDMVMAHSILHLVKDPKNLIQRIHSSLKSGGYLVSSTACIDDFFKLFRWIWPVCYKLGLFPYVQALSSQFVLQIHKDCGFEITTEWNPTGETLFLIAKKV